MCAVVQAGKGRAGLMSCVLLFRMGVRDSAAAAMDYYDETRVWNRKGLTVFSQRKAVIFYERLWRDYWHVQGSLKDVPAEEKVGGKYPMPVEPPVRVVGVQIVYLQNIPGMRLRIFKASNLDPQLLEDCGRSQDMTWDSDVTVSGNFKLLIERYGRFGKRKKFIELWHNTLFMTPKNFEVDFGYDRAALCSMFSWFPCRLHCTRTLTDLSGVTLPL